MADHWMVTELQTIAGWTVRVRTPESAGPHPIILMLHGWTGDENAMWVFARRMPPEALLIAPRGPVPVGPGGFGWHDNLGETWPRVEHFRPAVESLVDLLTPFNFPSGDLDQPLRLVGFSQGAALAFTFALLNPKWIRAVAGLSGFLPAGAASLVQGKPLRGKPVFMAHGTQDVLVPVERAREAVRVLQQAGARVAYCEDDVGHKLSTACFSSLGAFFQRY